ncbi:MAG: cytochrome c [Bacteroides sp.]|jgi:hypothetical protein|nr:cytochrome c [Bacteroides sp.]
MEYQIIKSSKFRNLPGILPAIFFLLLFSGCYYDSEEYLYPGNTPCDTENVTYQGFVAGLMQSHCNSCHNASNPSGNVMTDTYNNLMVIVNNGKLNGAINHLSGFSPMPKGGNKLPDCDLQKIAAWIEAGSPQ